MRISDTALGILLILPPLFLIAALMIYPLIYAVWLSFQSFGGFQAVPRFVGFNNYVNMFRDSLFYESLLTSVIWSAGTIILQMLVGLASALLLNEAFRGRSLLRGIVIFPYVLPTIVATLIWQWMYNGSYGILDYVLMSVHLIPEPLQWLGSLSLALPSVIFVGFWKNFPFVTICLLARLQTIREDLYEAAKVDGAGVWSRFIDVTIPQISGVAAVVLLLRTIWMFSSFDIIWLMTQGGPSAATATLPVYAFVYAFSSMSFGMGAAVSVVILLILVAAFFVYSRLMSIAERAL